MRWIKTVGKNETVCAHKLCGAGNGGFFLLFGEEHLENTYECVKVDMEPNGVTGKFMNPFDEYINTLKSAHMEVEFFKFQKAFHTHERIIILGNGGSNSVASHISQDYMKFHNKRVSILSDPSMITMLTNDFGYDKAYQKFLEYYRER